MEEMNCKPFLSHTKLDYDECRAKLILEEMFPNKYHNLIICDKPDLVGGDVGVEVTTANGEKYEKTVSNWISANNCNNIEKFIRYKKKASELSGFEYKGGIQVWPNAVSSPDDIKNAIASKIKKVDNYSELSRLELFIFTNVDFAEGCLVKDIERYISDNDVGRNYKTIHINSRDLSLCIFETETFEYRSVGIDPGEQASRNRRAMQMAINGQ